MGHILIEITGTSPLVCHNVQLADPDNDITKAMKAITSKSSKTEDDRRELERLEWFGGLYTDIDIEGPVMPTANIRRCFMGGGAITRKKTHVQRALSFTSLNVPIVYDGTRDIQKLYENPVHRYRAPVNVDRKKIMRMRPIWPRWVLLAEAYLQTDILSMADLTDVIQRSGLAEGLCENRTNGYGRFEAKVTPR